MERLCRSSFGSGLVIVRRYARMKRLLRLEELHPA
jgi:hypothetical protein